MKKRFTEEQIIGFLKQAAAGTPIKELSFIGPAVAIAFRW